MPTPFGFDTTRPIKSVAGLDGAYSSFTSSYILLGRADCIDDVKKK
jgi:hypothetical protein